jgi:NhaP-type Na+/H+ or K+/H+ antiporter
MLSLLVKEKVRYPPSVILTNNPYLPQLYINEVVLGTGFGVIIGPYVANVFTPREWGPSQNTVTLEVMRVVLATGLFAVGVELPCAYMKEHAKSLLIMVVPTMAFGWVVVAGMHIFPNFYFHSLIIITGVIQALFPQLNYISSLCIAACLTPTDPVTCAAITR